MTDEDTAPTYADPPRRMPLEMPEIMATVILTGIGTLIVVGFFLLPQLEEGSTEWRNRSSLMLCQRAQSDLAALPPDQRLSGYEVLGRIPPNLVIIEIPKAGEWNGPLRAALTEPDFQIVRVFVPREFDVPLTDGRDDYTIENAKVYLAQVKFHRRLHWIMFLTVWLAAWSSISWRLLLQAHRKANEGRGPVGP